jgi:hypothetical protein
MPLRHAVSGGASFYRSFYWGGQVLELIPGIPFGPGAQEVDTRSTLR